MKNYKIISFLLIILAVFTMSCEGPPGPPGADGADGVDGTDGTDGVAGNAVCLTCHNLALKSAVTGDYSLSKHGTSGTFYSGSPTVVEYAGGRVSCAKCHSHEGFVQTVHTGLDTVAATIPLPQNIQCKTCHDFHATLDFDDDGPDYAIRTASAVNLLMDDTKTIDFKNNSNLCANCHQPRTPGPVDDGAGNAMVTSKFYGPHHGPQSTVLEGIGGYEVAGSIDYPASQSTHRKAASCTSCHMHASTEIGEGGHTWNVPFGACTTCHPDATDFDVNGKQTEIRNLITELEQKLTSAGLLVDGSPNPGSYPVDQVGALYNYETMKDDRSDGVHNYPYIVALLQNSIEVFD
jgi:hypothetical protein